MKKILFSFLMVLFLVEAKTQLNTIYTNTSLNHVTIYNQGANVERNGKIKVEQGSNKLIIQNVSPSLINESIQIMIFSNNVIINSVQKQMNYLGASPPSKEMTKLKDSLNILL